MEFIFHSLAFRIAIDPAFFVPYFLVIGALVIEVLRCTVMAELERKRQLVRAFYIALPLLIISLYVVIGSPLAHDLARTDIEHSYEASFGDRIALLGYRLEPVDVLPGRSVHLLLYLQALDDLQANYMIFARVADEGGGLISQTHHYPSQNAYMTSQWLPQQIVQDLSVLEIQPDTPAGEYRIAVSIHEPTEGALPVYVPGESPTDGWIILPDTITVVGN